MWHKFAFAFKLLFISLYVNICKRKLPEAYRPNRRFLAAKRLYWNIVNVEPLLFFLGLTISWCHYAMRSRNWCLKPVFLEQWRSPIKLHLFIVGLLCFFPTSWHFWVYVKKVNFIYTTAADRGAISNGWHIVMSAFPFLNLLSRILTFDLL